MSVNGAPEMQIEILDIPPCELGESPLWCPVTQCFFWVDGLAPALYRLDWSSRRIDRQPLEAMVGSITRAVDGRLVLASARGLQTLAFGGPVGRLYAPPSLPEGVRFNDSKVGPGGNLVAGTMDIAEAEPIGAAYVLNADGRFTPVGGRFTVFNGPCWSNDGRSMFLSDSAGRAVNRFDYDPATGRTGEEQPWLRLSQADGLPDGATFDQSGFYWQARNGAGFLAVHAPDGTLVRRLVMPTANVTSLAFGGPELDVLLVTSMNRCLPWQDRIDRNAGRCFLVTGTETYGHIEPVTAFPF